MAEEFVGGEGFAVVASLIAADANEQRSLASTEAVDWQELAATRRSVREYLATLDETAWGAVIEEARFGLKPQRLDGHDPVGNASRIPGRYQVRLLNRGGLVNGGRGRMDSSADVIVLGAGMVGVSVALHLQKRGRDVVLIDRREAGQETSYGNAGLIQREAVIPYTFPRQFGAILSYAMNNRRDAVYHLSALPQIAPWLFRYWQNAAPERVERSARALAPLMARCVEEHDALIAEAGAAAQQVMHHGGWLNCFRSEESLRQAIADARRLDQYGVDYAVLTRAQLGELEPHVSEVIVGAIHFRGSPTSSDPGSLTKAYADLFARKGGRFCKGDARRLSSESSGWSVVTETGPIAAREAVVALGPWSDDVFRPLGYNIPLAVKRGYHMHYGVKGNATLGHPVRDADGGFALAPMSKGIRLTTGVEFADRDAPESPIQLARDEPLARELFPLSERLEPKPWMGRRPCLPDMVPVIGKGGRHHGLWFAFGHAHHGFTLGPVTGRLLAEIMTGEEPFTEPSYYSASRFRNGALL